MARLKVHHGKLDEAKRLAAESPHLVCTKGTRTLQSEMDFNCDNTEAHPQSTQSVDFNMPVEEVIRHRLGDATMKTMTCKQLGGACDKEFSGDTFEELAEGSKQHGMEMFQKGDEDHLEAMNAMKQRMADPGAMREWFAEKKREFDAIPED